MKTNHFQYMLKEDINYYFSLGFKVFPVNIHLTKVNGKAKKKLDSPIRWKSESITRSKVLKLLSANTFNGLAILTGRKSNLFILDIDAGNGVSGHDTLHQNNIVIPPNTPTVRTQSKGFHYYFTLPPFFAMI